jgi:hypothetical protein
VHILKQIDNAAIEYKKTRNVKYKNKWYKLIKRFYEMIRKKH